MKFEEIIKEQVINGFKFDIEKAQQLHIKLLGDLSGNEKKDKIINNRMTLLLSLMDYAESDKKSRIHGECKVNGTVTKRITHSNPNISGIPSTKSIYGKELRSLFTVENNKKLVGIDASGIELRLLAHYMNDKEYIKEIYEGDIHNFNMLNAGLKDRDTAKTFIYAFLYGIGDLALGKKLHNEEVRMTDSELKLKGKEIKKTFLKNLPKLQELKNEIEKNNNIKVLDNSIVVSEESYKNLNILLQTASSIIMKKALELFKEKLVEENIEHKFVANIHDEIQIEVNEEDSKLVGELGKKSIIDSGYFYKLNIFLDAEYKIGNNWSETH